MYTYHNRSPAARPALGRGAALHGAHHESVPLFIVCVYIYIYIHTHICRCIYVLK